jgi:hypothetical protein
MKLPLYAVLFLLFGTLSGVVGGWFFTFDTVVPWLKVAPEWQNLSGLLLFIFFFLEAGAVVGLIGSAVVAALGALGLYVLGSAVEKLKKKATVAPPQQ